MPPEMKQTQRVEQGLALTPQLKKSLEILQASALDLAGEVSVQLRTNPLLEDVSAEDFADRPQSVGGPADGEFSDFDDGYG